MNYSRNDTQPIDLRRSAETSAETGQIDSSRQRAHGRRSPSHVRLIIGVMTLAALAVIGTRLAGVLLAAGPTG